MQHKNLEVKDQSDPFRLDHEVKKLNQVARNLRHPETKGEISAGVLIQEFEDSAWVTDGLTSQEVSLECIELIIDYSIVC